MKPKNIKIIYNIVFSFILCLFFSGLVIWIMFKAYGLGSFALAQNDTKLRFIYLVPLFLCFIFICLFTMLCNTLVKKIKANIKLLE